MRYEKCTAYTIVKNRQQNIIFVDFSLLLHLLKVRTRCLKMPIHVTTSYRCVYLNTIKIAVNLVDIQLILVEQYILSNVHVLSYGVWIAIVYMYKTNDSMSSLKQYFPFCCGYQSFVMPYEKKM